MDGKININLWRSHNCALILSVNEYVNFFIVKRKKEKLTTKKEQEK